MRLTVFGATGGVGREIVGQALAAGHEVTAVVRDPDRLPDGLDRARDHLAECEPCAEVRDSLE
ncbi:NAD(P)H-binding protein, partial [Streptomyces cavourensis]|nr:NAD(P)H-binding protein [Streptomyces cavourensis]